MEIDEEIIAKISNFLVEKAARRSAILYGSIYSFFPPDTSSQIVWNTFEKACKRLANSRIAIYGALMAKKDTKLPSSGFYDIFRNSHWEEYLEITNSEHLQANELNLEQMKLIAQIERERVHIHATSNT